MRQPHSNHPGHEARDCLLRHTVTAAPCSSSSNGYACSWTGGHCVPSEACDERRKRSEEADRLTAEAYASGVAPGIYPRKY